MFSVELIVENKNMSDARQQIMHFLQAPGIRVERIAEPKMSEGRISFFIEYEYQQQYDEEEL